MSASKSRKAKIILIATLIGGAIGLFVGSSLGVAGRGGAVSGEVVFIPVGMVIGLLAGLLLRGR